MITAPGDRPSSAHDGEIADRLARVRERIASAAARAGREPDEVRLVVVTKDVPVERVIAAVEAGATDLGENRAQELLAKLTATADLRPAPAWHFIGSLQRNKVSAVTGRVGMIHSIDSVALGKAVAARAAAAGSTQDALLEVNVSGEPTKHGLAQDEIANALRDLAGIPGLRLRGLMTIAPEGDPGAARAVFHTLRALRDDLRATPGGDHLTHLSMGMTGDFELAIEEGATLIRLGTAIFGPRTKR